MMEYYEPRASYPLTLRFLENGFEWPFLTESMCQPVSYYKAVQLRISRNHTNLLRILCSNNMQLLSLFSSLLVLSTTLSLPVSVSAVNGEITYPTNGTTIMPGESFDFKYDGMADYSVSGYNYSVWLFTSLPQSFSPSESFGAGYYFGRYDYANYPG